MLGFIRHFVPHRGPPIGVDLGTRSLRLAQVDDATADLRLVHADRLDVPEGVAADAGQAAEFLARSLRATLATSPYRGRQVALSLPPSLLRVLHVRVPKGPEEDAPAHVREAAVAQLGGDASDWYVRHVIAGDVFGDGGSPQQEAVVFAAPQETIAQFLDAASAARVELVGVQVQPKVLADGFARFYRRNADADAVNLFVDLGCVGTRAFVAAPNDIRFVRDTPVNVTRAHDRVAKALDHSLADAALLRTLTIAQQTGRSNELPASAPVASDRQVMLQELTTVEARAIADELDLCRRYHEATFPAQPVSRLIFIGGGARDRLLCAAIAQAMSLPAQIGDPLIRFNRSALPSLACIDRREPQPDWAVAISLSLCGRTVAVSA